MSPQARPATSRDVSVLSGLVLFLGFCAEVWSFVWILTGNDKAVPIAIVGIGMALCGIGIRLHPARSTPPAPLLSARPAPAAHPGDTPDGES